MSIAGNIVILYRSRSGNTRAAAEATGELLADRGARVSVRPVEHYEIKEMAEADMLVLGTWTDGLFFIGQRPGELRHFKALPNLAGKPVTTFCTFALNAGKTIERFSKWVTSDGAQALGGHAIKRSDIADGAEELANLVERKMKHRVSR